MGVGVGTSLVTTCGFLLAHGQFFRPDCTPCWNDTEAVRAMGTPLPSAVPTTTANVSADHLNADCITYAAVSGLIL